MINISDQTKNTAVVRTQAILSRTLRDARTAPGHGRASYSFWMKKIDGRWRIAKFYIELDGTIRNKNKLPEPSDKFRIEPDTRSVCNNELSK